MQWYDYLYVGAIHTSYAVSILHAMRYYWLLLDTGTMVPVQTLDHLQKLTSGLSKNSSKGKFEGVLVY